jgi:hypothetical protein
MRNLFPGEYRPTEDEFSTLWHEAIFVFDTNVILNLYSYPEAANNSLRAVLNALGERVWIPYQVAFEFHKNRFVRVESARAGVQTALNTLQAQREKFRSVFDDLRFEERNTGITDLDQRIQTAEEAVKGLEAALNVAYKKLPMVSLDDPTAAYVGKVFDGRIGPPPESQEALEALYADGEDRYTSKRPPGFKDRDAKAKQPDLRDRDLTLPAMYGDLILWRQLLAHAKVQKWGKVVFVTDDAKADWWRSEHGKTLGPQPELISEFLFTTGATVFWMYDTVNFMKYGGAALNVNEVTSVAVEQAQSYQDSALKELGSVEASISTTMLGILDNAMLADDPNLLTIKENLQTQIEFFIHKRHLRVAVTGNFTEGFEAWHASELRAFYQVRPISSLSEHSLFSMLNTLHARDKVFNGLILLVSEGNNDVFSQYLRYNQSFLKNLLDRVKIDELHICHISGGKLVVIFELVVTPD